MKLSIYIAGRITGEDPDICKAKFAAIENKLKQLGVDTVINPLNLGIPISWTWEQAKEKCLDVLRHKATSIFLLDDWACSTGSIEEWEFAKFRGYRMFDNECFELIDQLVKHSGKWPDTSDYEFP